MANLVITSGNPVTGARTKVVVQLVDGERNPISAFNATVGFVVSRYESRTDTSGDLTIDLPANSTFDVDNTYYLVTVGEFSRLIEKTGSSQSLEAASVDEPAEVPAVAAHATTAQLNAHIADTTDAHAASAITNTPAGSIAATTVQAAINELDGEKQPLDTDLTAIAALVSAADKVPYATGAGTWALTDLTAAARTVLDDATVGAMRTTLDVPSNSEAVLDTLVDAKGDIVTASAADTPARLAVGTDGHVLTADSAQATGIKWAAASAGTVDVVSNVATARILGRTTAGSGDSEELSFAATLAALSGTATGAFAWNAQNLTGVAALTATGEVIGSDFAPASTTGATVAFRYFRGTASGAPASGTWVAGDIVPDQTGRFWLCTTGGTPGTWCPMAGLLGVCSYDPGTTASYSTSGAIGDVDATNLLISFVAPASGAVLVRWTARCGTSNTISSWWGIREASSQVGGLALVWQTSTGSGYQPRTQTLRITGLTPGSAHTYKWAFAASGAAFLMKAGQTANDEGPATMEIYAA